MAVFKQRDVRVYGLDYLRAGISHRYLGLGDDNYGDDLYSFDVTYLSTRTIWHVTVTGEYQGWKKLGTVINVVFPSWFTQAFIDDVLERTVLEFVNFRERDEDEPAPDDWLDTDSPLDTDPIEE